MKPTLRIAIEIILIAVPIAVGMTVCASLVSLNPRADNPTVFQTVLFVLNIPALFIWMGSGPENDPSGAIFRVFVFMQWIVLGGGIGALVAFVRRELRRT